MNFTIPVIILKNLVILPNQEIKIDLNNKVTKKILLSSSNKYDGKILVVSPMDLLEEQPSVDDLPLVGVMASVKNKIILDNSTRITLRGIKRIEVIKYYQDNTDNDILLCLAKNVKYDINNEDESILKNKLDQAVKEYVNEGKNISNSIINTMKEIDPLTKTTDIVASFLPLDIKRKQAYINEINPCIRAKMLLVDINKELKNVKIDNEIDELVDISIAKDQKDYYLKERLKVIKHELGDTTIQQEDAKLFKEQLSKLKLEKNVYEKIDREINKYEVMNPNSPEISVLRNYLDWILNLPWNKMTKEESNFNLVQIKLDESHYGLEKVKERIIEYIAIKNFNQKLSSPIICLVGPPGVGKTSIATKIAEVLNRKFYKISVGGLSDATELIGSRRTYLAANPGKIIQGIRKVGSKNPLILIDEVDKLVKDYKGDPASVLLEILDPVQNKYFTDNYIEEAFDLSNVLFILTANQIETIPKALIDRVEVIELNSYTSFEKKDIAKSYILPKIFKEYNLDLPNIKFTDNLIYFIINSYTLEPGVRELERVLTRLIRKIVINNIKTINQEKVVKLLGNPIYKEENYPNNQNSGVVNVIAKSLNGGIVSLVEVVKYEGNGDIIITGSVQDILKESISVCLSYVKSEYKFNLNKYNMHFHFMDTSTKKDGPSAGVSITTAILSLLYKKPISKDIAFMGEITLNGNILKVGAVKEKLIGAYNNNIKTIYIPNDNVIDLIDVPKEILDNIEIKPVSNYKEVYLELFK